MKVYWCQGCGGGRNFGDQLTPLLLAHFGIPVEWAPAAEAQLLAVGSVLSAIPKHGWRGTVIGTGFIQPGMRRDLHRANVVSVRGHWTRRAAGLPIHTSLGELGVLAPLLADGRQAPPVRELVVPHYVDHSMALRHPDAAVMPITADPRDLIAAVAAAGIVFTSSLHGLILADAMAIPHSWEPHGEVRGGRHKFVDYLSAMDETIRPGVERLSDRGAMLALQERARGWIEALR